MSFPGKKQHLSGVLLLTLTLALALALAGCGDEDHHDDAENNHAHNNAGTGEFQAIVEMACGQAEDNGAALTAADDEAGASAVVEHGAVYDVTLPASGVGFVTFTTAEMHTTLIMFTDQVDAVAQVHGGAEAVTVLDLANDHCADALAGRFNVHVHEPGTYTLELHGSGTVRLISLIGEVGHNPDANSDDHEHNNAAANNHDHG